MAIGRKRIAEAVRAFAAECAAGTAPPLGINFGAPGCAVQRVAERVGAHDKDGSAGYVLGLELCREEDVRIGAALTAVYMANDSAPPEKRAAAVVAPLNALADALDPPVAS